VLEDVMRLEPGAADAAFELAQALERAGEGGRAAGAYASYLERFPGNERWRWAALRLGYLRASGGRKKEALDAFRLAAQAEAPEIRGPARYEIAKDLEAAERPEEALSIYEKLAEEALGAPWGRASAWRAAALRERQKDWEGALSLYRRLSEEKAAGEGDSRQALARVKRIEGYLKEVEEREEKMKKRVPLLR
jgi:tetratricopeptide (TPR) repeat protein